MCPETGLPFKFEAPPHDPDKAIMMQAPTRLGMLLRKVRFDLDMHLKLYLESIVLCA
jgi:hypothetical protein